MRWRLLGLFLFAVAGVVAWMFWVRPEAEIWLKQKLETTLSRQLGQEVHLDSLSLHPLLFRIEATGIRVGPLWAPLFSCRRWTFYTATASNETPLSLFFFTLARSELDRPTIHWVSGPGTIPPLPVGWWRELPLHRLVWTRGELKVALGTNRPSIDITDAEGDLQLSPGGFLLSLKGASSLGRFRLGLTGVESLHRGPQLNVQGEVNFERAPLEFFTPWLPPSAGRFLGVGDLSAKATINNLVIGQSWPKDAQWEVEARLKEALWFPPTARAKDLGVPLEGLLSARNGRVDFKNLRFFHSLNVSGSVDMAAGGDLRLSWRGKNVALADVAESGLVGVGSLPHRGTVSTEGTVRGPVGRPALEWTADLHDAGYPGLLLPDMGAQGSWKDDWFSLKTRGPSGQVDVGGTLRAGGSPSTDKGGIWTVRAANVDLSTIAKRNGWPRVKGLLNGHFSLVGTTGEGGTFQPEASGTLQIDDFVWGVHQETAPVQGHLVLDREGLRVRGAEGNFDMDVRSSSGVWRVERLAYQSGGLRVWGQGIVIDGKGRLQLEGGLQGLSLGDMPMLAKMFPSVEGTLSTEGRLHGRWTDPVFTGTIKSEGIRWRPGGRVHSGQADVRGGRGGLTVSRFQWDDAVTGEGAVLFGKGMRFSAEVEKTPAAELFDFFVSSDAVGGWVSGRASLSSGDQPGWEGWVRLSGEKGHWGGVSFDDARAVVFFRGPRVDVDTLDIRQTSGNFRANGTASRRAPTAASPAPAWDWRGSGSAETFTAGPVVWSGSWTVRGIGRFREGTGEGEFQSPGLTLFGSPGVSLGSVRSSYSWSPAAWRVGDLTVERGIHARGEIDRQAHSLSGKVEVSDLSLPSLFPALADQADVRFGIVAGSGTVTGDWANPRGELALTLANAGWKDIGAAGDLHLVWQNTFELPRLSLTFSDGGQFTLQGGWDLLAGALTVGGDYRRPDDLSLQWKSSFMVTGATATVEEAVLTTDEGRWQVRPGSRISRAGNGVWTYAIKNDLRNIHVGPLQLFGGLLLAGQIMPGDRVVSGRLTADSLWINQRAFDQELADFRLSPSAVEFSPISGASAFVQGRVRLNGWPQTYFENLTVWDKGRRILVLAGDLGPTLWDFSLQGWGIQAESLLTLADFDWPITGPWDVRVRGHGSLKSPDVQAEVTGGPGRMGPLPYDRLEAQAHWVGDRVDVRGLKLLRRKGYLLTGEGQFPVREGTGFEESDLNLHLTDGKLAVLKDVWPLCRSAKGSFFGDVRVVPGKTVPLVTGSFHVVDGRMDLTSYAPHVREINGEITFQNDRARVEFARARVGSGWIEMAGDIGIHGLSPVEYDLSIQSSGKRGVAVEVPQLSVPPGPLLGQFSFLSDRLKGISYGEPWVSLHVKGPHGQHVISGEATLEGTHFTYPPAKGGFEGVPGPRWWRNFWRLAAWDILFKTGKDTWYRNEYLNVRLDGTLHLAGQPGEWTLNGRVGTTEGAINYLGQMFQVKKGMFEAITEARTAKGGGGILPYVSGEAERVVTTVDARGLSTDDTISMVVDRSLLGEIQPRFVSRNDPDLKSDRVAMKALGISTDQQGTPADRDLLLRAGLVQLVGSSAAPLANRLAQKLGIGIISPIYEPPEAQETAPTVAPVAPKNGSSAKASPLTDYLRGAGASARIRITDRLSGVYKVKLDEAKNQTYFRDQIEIVLRLRGSVYVRASTELDSTSLLGQPPERRAILENQWRFGLPKRKKKEGPEPVK